MGNSSFSKVQSVLFGKKHEDHKQHKDSTLKIWCHLTTFHGITDWYTAKHWYSFVLWGLLFLTCMVCAILQVRGLFRSFFAYPHYSTNLYVEDKEFADFPNITICNFNRVNKLRAQASQFAPLFDYMSVQSGVPAPQLKSFFLTYLFWSQFTTYDAGLDYVKQAVAPAKMVWDGFYNTPQVPASSKDPYNLFKLLGHQCTETFVICLWAGQKFNCCDLAVPIINGEYGLCWSLVPPRSTGQLVSKQTLPGITNGLKLILNVGLDLYLQDVFLNNYLEQGMVLTANYNPYHMSFLNPIALSPGSHTRVGLRTMIRRYTEPKIRLFQMECTNTGQLEIMKGEYDRPNCIKDCIQKFMKSKCNCTFVSERKTADRTCNGNDVTICLDGWIGNVENSNDTEKKTAMDQCMANCKQPCHDGRTVTATTTTDAYPAAHHAEKIQSLLMLTRPTLTIENVKEAIMVDLYYPSRGFQLVERVEKYPIFELIGNIGGQMGLWLGASILTVIQVVYYVFYGIFRLFYDKKNEDEHYDYDADNDIRKLSRSASVSSANPSTVPSSTTSSIRRSQSQDDVNDRPPPNYRDDDDIPPPRRQPSPRSRDDNNDRSPPQRQPPTDDNNERSPPDRRQPPRNRDDDYQRPPPIGRNNRPSPNSKDDDEPPRNKRNPYYGPLHPSRTRTRGPFNRGRNRP